MLMIDPFSLKYRKDFVDVGIDPNKFYFVAFFNGDNLDTRPIKLTSVFDVHSSKTGSIYLRTEAAFEYHFETEKKTYKEDSRPKVLDKYF